MVHDEQFFFAQNTSNAMHRTHSPEGTGRYQIRWMEGREGIVAVGQEDVGGVTRGTIFMHSAHRPVLHLPRRLNLTNSEILRSTSRELREWGLMLTMENPVVSVRVWKIRKDFEIVESNRMLSNLSRFGKLAAAVRMKAPCMNQSWQSG